MIQKSSFKNDNIFFHNTNFVSGIGLNRLASCRRSFVFLKEVGIFDMVGS